MIVYKFFFSFVENVTVTRVLIPVYMSLSIIEESLSQCRFIMRGY